VALHLPRRGHWDRDEHRFLGLHLRVYLKIWNPKIHWASHQ
jgi:hypothetical protein